MHFERSTDRICWRPNVGRERWWRDGFRVTGESNWKHEGAIYCQGENQDLKLEQTWFERPIWHPKGDTAYVSLELRGRRVLSADASFQFSAHVGHESHVIETDDWAVTKWVRGAGQVVWRPRPRHREREMLWQGRWENCLNDEESYMDHIQDWEKG